MKDYGRLKTDENSRLSLNWNLNREISKLNYRIHTDAIKENLIPPVLTPAQIAYAYANEVGEEELYKLFYDYDSSFEYGLWGAVRESALLKVIRQHINIIVFQIMQDNKSYLRYGKIVFDKFSVNYYKGIF